MLKEYINHRNRNTIVNSGADIVVYTECCFVCVGTWYDQLSPDEIKIFDTSLALPINIIALNAVQDINKQFDDTSKVIPITLGNCKCKARMCFHCAITILLLPPPQTKTCPTCRKVYNFSDIKQCDIIIPQNDVPVLAQEIKTPSTPNNIVRVPSNETIV